MTDRAFLKGSDMVDERESSQLFNTLLFPKIFQTFRIAIQPSKLIIAFLAVVAICLAGYVMDFSETVVVTKRAQGEVAELQVYIDNPELVQGFIERYKESGQRRGVFSTLWHFGSARFHSAIGDLFELNLASATEEAAAYFRAVGWALRYHLLYCLIFFAIKLVVLSIAGGGLCRIAALQFAQGEKPGLGEALRFSIKNFTSFFTAPLAPVIIIAFIGLFIFLLGLVGNIPWVGELIMGIFMPLAFVAGALIAVVLIGTFAGFNLMFPAVAYDGSDCFDAISRSFSYVYSRPWRMAFYTGIAAIYGAVCYMFVRFFAFLLLWVARLFLQFGVLGGNDKLEAIWARGPSFSDLPGSLSSAAGSWPESVASFLVYISVLAVVGLVASFLVSFYFSANTIIYSLMRNKIDNTALEDVYTYSNEDKAQTSAPESEPEPEEE